MRDKGGSGIVATLHAKGVWSWVWSPCVQHLKEVKSFNAVIIKMKMMDVTNNGHNNDGKLCDIRLSVHLFASVLRVSLSRVLPKAYMW